MLMASVVVADTGISMSYRSTPMKLKVENRGEFYRTMETASLNIYFDDFLRARDKNKRSAHVEKVYYVRHHADIDNEHPIGEIWYEEVDLKGVARSEYNTLNHKKPGLDGYIYEKDVLVSDELKNSWLPDTINPAKGAGYIFGLNLNIGSASGLVDMYSADLYIGKRVTLLPHLIHTYFKIGPSMMLTAWDIDVLEYRFSNIQLGAVTNLGIHIQVLKGVKVFVESEWRVYGPYISQETSSELEMVNKMPFWDKDFVIDLNDKEGSFRGVVRESLRFGIKFSF
tara:strand:- start:1702 stop:2550 length:849 start_codon:yes stop_codon:yes gene_type:complete